MELNLQLGIDVLFPWLGLQNLNNISSDWEDLTLDNASVTVSTDIAMQSKKFVHKDNNAKDFEWWQVFDTQYLLHSVTWTVIAVLAYSIILVAGLVGNSLVISTYIFRPKMRSVTNIFIMNLAIADLLSVLFCFLGNLLANTIKPWILGSFMCKTVGFVQGVSVCASAFFLAAISVDRCKAIGRPFARTNGLSRRQATYAVILIWLLALFLSMPWIVTLTLVEKGGLCYCVERWKKKTYRKAYFLLVNLFISYIIPLIVIITTNLIIWYRIENREIPNSIASALTIKQMHRQTRNGVRKMLGIVTVVFLLSWLPLHILLIRYRCFKLGKTEKNILNMMLPFAQWVGSCNSSINPVLYAYLNRKFRVAFKSFLPCWNYFQGIKGAGNHGPNQV